MTFYRHLAYSTFIVVLLLLIGTAHIQASSIDCVRPINFEMHKNWLANAITGEVIQSFLPNTIAPPFEISPDGKYVIYRNPDQGNAQNEDQLIVQSWDSEPVILQSDISNNLGANVKFQWSPDNQRFIYTSISGYLSNKTAKINISIAEPDGSQTQVITYTPSWKALWNDAPFLEVNLLGWSDNSEYTAFIHPDGINKNTELNFWSVSKKQLTRFKLPPIDSPYDPRFIGQVWSDHQLAFVHSSYEKVNVVSIDNKTIGTYNIPPSEQQFNRIEHLVWSPDGKFLAVLSGYLDILDVQGQKFLDNIHVPLTSHVGFPQYCGDCVYPRYNVEPVTWSSDSQTVYLFQGSYDVLKPADFVGLNVVSGNPVILIKNIKDAHWLIPARQLIYSTEDINGYKLNWFDTRTKKSQFIGKWPFSDFRSWDVLLSPNQKKLILTFLVNSNSKDTFFDTVVDLVSLDGMQKTNLLTYPYLSIESIAWSPDSTHIAILKVNEASTSDLIIFNEAGVMVRQFTDPLNYYGGTPMWTECNQETF
jgi:hypothetical protein